MSEFFQFNTRPAVSADSPTRRSYENTQLHSAQDDRWLVSTVGGRYGARPNWRRCSQGEDPVQLQRRDADVFTRRIQFQTAAPAHDVTSERGRRGPDQYRD